MIYRGIKKPVISHGKYGYEVIAELPISKIIDVKEAKKYLKCDLVLHNKKIDVYLFGRRIEEANIIDEKESNI